MTPPAPAGADTREAGRDEAEPPDAGPDEREFGRRGWLLLVGVVVAFVVVPAVIYLRPPGVPFVVAYLVLPLVPAVALALLAVWATT